MDYRKAAQGVLDNIGGASNVASAAHCATRLRLVIADNTKVNKAAVEQVEGVKGCFEAAGQLQVIFGTGTVNKVFDEFIAISGVEAGSKEAAKEAAAQQQNFFMRAIKTLGDIFVPIIPAIVASGLLNGLLGGLSRAIPTLADSSIYSIINMFAGAALTMLPVLIAVSAAKKFGGNQFLAAVIGFIMIHPDLVNAWTQYIDDGAGNMILNPAIKEFFHIGGYSVTNLGYQGHVIPVIIAILFMCWLEKKLHKIVPEMIDLFVTPLVTVLVTGLLTIIVIGPIFSTVEGWILAGATTLIGLPFGIGGLLVGFLYAFTVVAGFHHMYTMIEAQMLGMRGLNTWMPVATAANVAQGAAAMAVAFKTKNKHTKSMALPSSLSAFLGITEPAIFGVNVRYRKPFIAACIGGGIGGMVAALFKVGATAYGVTGLFGFLITPGFLVQYAIVMVVAFVVAFALSFIMHKDPAEELQAAEVAEPGEEVSAAAPAAPVKAASTASEGKAAPGGEGEVVYAPITGEAVPAEKIQDPTFAAEALGRSVGIIPSEGKVYAPFDGSVDMVFDTKHAIALSTDDGLEVLIHVGVDTVNLEGKGYVAHVESGAEVKKGDLLLTFDMDVIKAAGYKTDTPVIITNTDEYSDIRVLAEGPVRAGDAVLRAVK